MKLKGRHFDTIEVIEAESRAVLKTLTKHDFQEAFQNGRSSRNGAYACRLLVGHPEERDHWENQDISG
jgi:hypothetical protein